VHPAQTSEFEWDEYNELHLARHGITAPEAEEVFDNAPIWLRDTKSEQERWLMIGRTNGGRWLTMVVEVNEAGLLRAFTGRPSPDYQKNLYRQQRGNRR
jgi:uncharacterized protein